MSIKNIEETILTATCSKSLLCAIKERKFKFNDFDLLILAYRYSPTYEKQIELLRLIFENAEDERTKAQAEKCIRYKESEFAKFVSNEKDSVFEVVITERETDYKDRLLTKTYQVAVDSMKYFCEHYSKNEFEISRIEILKRKVNSSVTDEYEEGRAKFNENLELADIDHYKYDDEKKWLCPKCNCYYNDDETVDNECFLHREIELPKFIKDMDLITYKSYHDTLGTSEYAINIDWDDDDGNFKTGSNLCIPLDNAKILNLKTGDDLFNEHTHVEYVHIDLIDMNAAPKNIQRAYRKVVKILLKEGVKKGESNG